MQWYVVAQEPPDPPGDSYVNVWGPFIGETDARAFALDVANDNGWASVEAKQLAHDEAKDLATDKIFWPYTSEEGS